MTLLAPQAHQAQIAAGRQQPAHRRTGWAVLLRAVPHLHIDILCKVLRVVRVFKVGKRETVHRRARALIQLRQSVTLTAGNAEDQLLQLVPLLCRRIFGCHQQAEHRLPSPVIHVMHGKDNLLQGNLNFLKKNAMGLGKEVRPLFTAETAKSKAYRKQER